MIPRLLVPTIISVGLGKLLETEIKPAAKEAGR